MPHARTTDPVTSHEAAESVKNLTATQEEVLRIIRVWKSINDVELVAQYKRLTPIYGLPAASESGIRSRRAELVKSGKVIDSGDREKLPSGRNAILWTLA